MSIDYIIYILYRIKAQLAKWNKAMTQVIDSKVKKALHEIGSTIFQDKISQDKACLYCKNGVYWETSIEALLTGANCDCTDCNPHIAAETLRQSKRKEELTLLKDKLSENNYTLLNPSNFESLDELVVILCSNSKQRTIKPRKFIAKPIKCECKLCYNDFVDEYPKQEIAKLNEYANSIGYTITSDFSKIKQGEMLDITSHCGTSLTCRYVTFFQRRPCECVKCLEDRISKFRTPSEFNEEHHFKVLQNHFKINYIPKTSQQQIQLIVNHNPAYCRVKNRIPGISHIEFLSWIDYISLSNYYQQRKGLTVDHIIPIKYFPRTIEHISVSVLGWNSHNLRYLDKTTNVDRSATITQEDCKLIAYNDLLFTVFCGVILNKFDIAAVMRTLT
jgi:hypothetical protein